MKTLNLFMSKNYNRISNVDYSDDKILIYWKDETLLSGICSKSAIAKFKELKEKYTDKTELYKEFFSACTLMLNMDLNKYREDAIKEASVNPKIFKIRCINKDGTINKTRAQFDRNTAELYGMFEDEIIQMCIDDVLELRRDDTAKTWHLLDQNNKIIY